MCPDAVRRCRYGSESSLFPPRSEHMRLEGTRKWPELSDCARGGARSVIPLAPLRG